MCHVMKTTGINSKYAPGTLTRIISKILHLFQLHWMKNLISAETNWKLCGNLRLFCFRQVTARKLQVSISFNRLSTNPNGFRNGNFLKLEFSARFQSTYTIWISIVYQWFPQWKLDETEVSAWFQPTYTSWIYNVYLWFPQWKLKMKFPDHFGTLKPFGYI